MVGRRVRRQFLGLCAALFAWWASAAAAQTRAGEIPAQDYYEIQQLYSRYCHGLDTAADNGYRFADVFLPDGVYVDVSGVTYTGREQLAQFARLDPDRRKGPTNVAHYTTNVQIAMTADGATGTGYLLKGQAAPTARQGEPAPTGRAEVNAGGQYRDELVKTAAGWRIKRRTLVSITATPSR